MDRNPTDRAAEKPAVENAWVSAQGTLNSPAYFPDEQDSLLEDWFKDQRLQHRCPWLS